MSGCFEYIFLVIFAQCWLSSVIESARDRGKKFVPFAQTKFENCVSMMGAGHIDTSGLQLYPINDTTIALNGSFSFLKRIDSPWDIQFSTERYIKRKWVVGEFNRQIDDFCAVIQDENEPWYLITSLFQNKYCPFEKGMVETFNEVLLTDWPKEIPSSFRGIWRMSITMMASSNRQTTQTCKMFNFEIIEI